MKRAQLLSQPFVFIFMLIVVVLLLYFGFNLLSKTINYGDDVEYDTFLLTLEKELESLRHLDKGSSITLRSLSVPRTVDEVCFIGQTGSARGSFSHSDLSSVFSTLDEGIVIHLTKENRFYDTLAIDRVYGDTNPRCDLTDDGTIDLKAVNYGGYVVIEVLA